MTTGSSKRKLNAFVLIGEGIECELETVRMISHAADEFETILVSIASLVKGNFPQIKKDDFIFLPGGFSYSDHFGSGKLLAHDLMECGFFKTLFEAEAHLVGICNGFQVMVRAGFFGDTVSLGPNLAAHKNGNKIKPGFVDRWVRLSAFDAKEFSSESLKVFLPVRHGEGRLVVEGELRDACPFLFYQDENFNNGSLKNIAGLWRKQKNSHLWGLMPHPEIALRKRDRPDFRGPEYIEENRLSSWQFEGDGLLLFNKMVEFSLTSRE